MLLKSPQKTTPVEGLGASLPAARSPALSQHLEKGRPLWSLPPDRDHVPPRRPQLRSREGAKEVTSDSEEPAVPQHRAVPRVLCRDVLQRPLLPPLCSPCFLEPLSHPRSLASLSVITKAWRKLSGQAGERSWRASCLGLTRKQACCPHPFPLQCVPMPQCTAQSLDSPAMPFCSVQPDTCTEHQ